MVQERGADRRVLWQALTRSMPCRELEHREDDAHLPAGRQSPPPGPSPHRQPRAPTTVRGPLCGHADAGLEHLPSPRHRGLPRVRLACLSRGSFWDVTVTSGKMSPSSGSNCVSHALFKVVSSMVSLMPHLLSKHPDPDRRSSSSSWTCSILLMTPETR